MRGLDVASTTNATGADHDLPARRGAAALFALSGLAVLIGSLTPWGYVSCGFCGSLPWPASGIALGPGVVTAHVGLLMVLAGIDAFRRGGCSPFRTEAVALALVAPIVIGAYSVATDVAVPITDWWEIPVGFVAMASLAGAVAAGRLRPSDARTRAWVLERRPTLVLLVAGSITWSLAENGNLAIRVEPLTYALVLIALGIGQWPGRLPGTRFEPTTFGVLVILYGALCLALLVLTDAGFGLLEAAPIALLVGIIASILLDVPPPMEDVASAAGRPSDVPFLRSVRGLMVAALLLTGSAIFLLATRLIGTGDVFFRVVSADLAPATAIWRMLAVGIAIAGCIVLTTIRRVVGRRAGTLSGAPGPSAVA